MSAVDPRGGVPQEALATVIGADDEQRVLVQRALHAADLSLQQLWLRFFAVGGAVGMLEVEAYLAGLMPLPEMQRNMLALAVNGRLDEMLYDTQVPYGRSVPSEPTPSRDLAALLALLNGASSASPDELPALAVAAGRILGVGVVMYLVDHGQDLLVPVSIGLTVDATAHERQPLGIDSTLAGRAFRQAQTLPSETDESPRLWMPLLDGAERLGVLDVQLAHTADLSDRALRQECEHLARLLGHLVVALSKQGDALDGVRRRRPRTVAAELVWQLLPPPTGGTDAFTLSGWIEPAHRAGGDSFDYAVSSTTASLAVFDAMGHGLPAGLMAAATVAAHRSARRNGEGLLEQARVIDQTIGSLGDDGSFVTGFLGELDLSTGRLRYLSAGHPSPLLLRDGRVVRELAGGRRVPFGLSDVVSGPEATAHGEEGVGVEDLQPGDCVIVHTDGVTEARDPYGTFFGDARLRDVLERAAAAGQSLAETARWLAQAVLKHRDSQLEDDATVLLGCWSGRGPRRLAQSGDTGDAGRAPSR